MTAPTPPSARRRERGATLVLVSISMVTLLAFTALAVDIGRGASRNRDLQQVADIVAMDVVRVLGDAAETDPALLAAVDAQVLETTTRNDFPITGAYPNYATGTRSLVLDLGCWIDPPLDGSAPGTFLTTCAEPNAVEVSAEDTVDYAFADVIGIRNGEFTRTATASRTPKAFVGIGTIAAGIQQSLAPVNSAVNIDATVQALNARLRAAFGNYTTITPPPNGVGLDVVSYRGLAASDIAVGDLATHLGFASPAEAADATITNGDLFEATALALEGDGSTVAATAIRSFAGRSDFNAAGTSRLGDGPLQFEQGTGTVDEPRAAQTRINVMELLVGTATIANGENFGAFTFNPTIPGVASVRVDNYVVQGVQWRWGPIGTQARSAQVRAQVTVNLTPSVLGIPGLTAPLSLPLVIEGASGTATLTGMRCYDPETLDEADVAAQTSLASVRIGVAQNLQVAGPLVVNAATLIQAGPLSLQTVVFLGLNPLLGLVLGGNITGSGTVSLGGGASTHVFLPNATPNPPQRSMGGVSGNLGTSLQSAFSIVAPLGVSTSALSTSLSQVFNGLGGGVIDPILHAAGITLGGADIFSRNADCSSPVLVG